MTEPTTAAGRALLDRLGELPKLMPYDDEARELILAIEAEAALAALPPSAPPASGLRGLVSDPAWGEGHRAAKSAPPALDVERLAEALRTHYRDHPGMGYSLLRCAEELAAEYARLEQDR